MKTIKYILLSCLVVLAGACDDFLVEEPTTQIQKEGVYNSEGTALGALSGCYAKMAAYDGYSFNYYHVLTSTSVLGVSIKANDVNLSELAVLTTNVNVGKVYIGQYDVIKAANDIVDGMQTSQIKNEAVKNKIVGEATFIRAISYFNLIRIFGKVSLITKPVTSYAEAHAPREEVDKVYEQIIIDLKDAFDVLPEPGKQDVGRPHKYAAKAMLAKVYLTMAGNNETSPYWQNAYDAALDVYNNGKYTLVRPYASLFGSGNKNNAESIFEIQFAVGQNGCRLSETTVVLGHPLMPNAVNGNTWGKTRPTKYAYDRFDDNDPRKEVTFIHSSYTNKHDNTKYLLYPTIRNTPAAKGLKYKQGDSEYAAWKKYIDPTLTTYSNCNFVYYRYADLLLVLAEAANELNKKDEATGYLNEVLDRAKDINGDGNIDPVTEIYPLSVVSASVTKEQLRDKIMNERLSELSGECDDWYTVRRRGEAYLKIFIKGHNDNIASLIASLPKFVYELPATDEAVKRNMLLPFPADEIIRNENISQDEQNYGY